MYIHPTSNPSNQYLSAQIAKYKDLYDQTLKFPEYIRRLMPDLLYELPQSDDQNFKILCPLHDENTPSFLYSANMDIWTCFGSCNTSGQVVKFHYRYLKKNSLDPTAITYAHALKDLYKLFPDRLPKLELTYKTKPTPAAINNINNLDATILNELVNFLNEDSQQSNQPPKSLLKPEYDDINQYFLSEFISCSQNK